MRESTTKPSYKKSPKKREAIDCFKIAVIDLAAAWKISVQGTQKYLRESGNDYDIIGNKSFLDSTKTRHAMLDRGVKYPKQTICLQMLKGGVGKTTTAINLGIRASMYGARVLLIDLDQQANLSFAFGFADEKQKVWADVLESKCLAKSLVQIVHENLHVIPSNLNNSVLDKILYSGKKNIALGIQQHLKPITKDYDLIIIDTAPNLSAINVAASCASDLAILPVNPDKFSFDGLQKTLSDLAEVKREFSVKCQPRILFTKFDARETSSRALLGACYSKYEKIMLSSYIRTSSDFKNVIQTGSSIFSHKSTAKEDYDAITRELLGI